MTNNHEDDSNHLAVELSQSISDIKSGKSRKKPKSGEQNCRKQKLLMSDMEPPKWPNFYSQNPYNRTTTQKANIYLFPKNLYPVIYYL